MITTSTDRCHHGLVGILFLSLVVALVASAPALASGETAESMGSSIEVDELWLRESVPGAQNGAAFGRISNSSDEAVMLIGADSSVAESVEVHQHVHRDGQMAMEEIEALTIPAGDSVTLQPGGYHIMLMHLKTPLVVGDSHSVTLYFSNDETFTMDAPVHPLVR